MIMVLSLEAISHGKMKWSWCHKHGAQCFRVHAVACISVRIFIKCRWKWKCEIIVHMEWMLPLDALNAYGSLFSSVFPFFSDFILFSLSFSDFFYLFLSFSIYSVLFRSFSLFVHLFLPLSTFSSLFSSFRLFFLSFSACMIFCPFSAFHAFHVDGQSLLLCIQNNEKPKWCTGKPGLLILQHSAASAYTLKMSSYIFILIA